MEKVSGPILRVYSDLDVDYTNLINLIMNQIKTIDKRREESICRKYHMCQSACILDQNWKEIITWLW